MVLDLGEATAATSGDGRATGGRDVPPALRGHRPAWRDPRLWFGIVLVAASVVLGARVLAGADDTVRVWAVADDVGAGQRIGADDLVAQRVRFADDDALSGYYTVEDELPGDLELVRSVGSGELLPRSAVGTPSATGLVEVPVAVEPELVPPGVGPGDTVDVYVVAPLSADADGSGEPLPDGAALSEVTVVDAPDVASSFGTSGRRQLVLAVPEADAPGFFGLLARYDTPSLTIVRRG
ncbi:flagellar biosynthesis protein FlgA [Nocardioides anomalus]|uniref:Flagellar biosynthesis protein FlgA n=1 Tax=Nocardioides anomalus TaxID=2712223 RepID=A0A6G6WFU9_9ACTN|nr:flagellar biosynthesis protein FlgA [Nocardioides anomalus]QIG44221.1 flagellar biosynthesis protein FlgA [Nocardioides anomalus]